MNNQVFTHDAFLSHSAKDKAVVRAVAERLLKDGLRVWFDEWQIANVLAWRRHVRAGGLEATWRFHRSSLSWLLPSSPANSARKRLPSRKRKSMLATRVVWWESRNMESNPMLEKVWRIKAEWAGEAGDDVHHLSQNTCQFQTPLATARQDG